MSTEKLPEELREFLLGRTEHDDTDYHHYSSPCYNLTWDKKKSHWVVRMDGKRIAELSAEDFAEDVDIQSYDFIDHILRILRDNGPEGLRVHIEELRCAKQL
jgi:hypothetical protein